MKKALKIISNKGKVYFVSGIEATMDKYLFMKNHLAKNEWLILVDESGKLIDYTDLFLPQVIKTMSNKNK